jgi:hypothetical protein
MPVAKGACAGLAPWGKPRDGSMLELQWSDECAEFFVDYGYTTY